MKARTERRKNLVLTRAGDNSLHEHWIAGNPGARNWDLQLNVYGRDESTFLNGDLPAVVDHGTRYDSVARHFAAQPHLLDDYEYIMIIEDDMLMDMHGINAMFDIAAEYDLTIAQPSLTYDSYISYPILLNCPGFTLRYTNYLEAQANVIKSSYLRKLLPLYARFNTGWGIDHVAALLMESPAERAAIIDAVQMKHTRPLYSGPIYKQLAAANKDPLDDLRTIRAGFSNLPKGFSVYRSISRTGRKMGGTETMLRNAAYLAANAFRCRKKKLALRIAAILTWRSVAMRDYEPVRAVVAPGSAVADVLNSANS